MRRGAALLAFLPAPAAAHGAGPGGFVGGLLHPLVAVEHLVLLLALGLLAGTRPVGRRGAAYGAAALGLLAGLAAGPVPAAPAVLALAGACGVLLAWAPARLPDGALPLLAGAAGLAVGLDTDAVPAEAPWAAAGGVLLGAALVVLNGGALGHAAARIPVALRVAGSWVAAFALLLLALAVAA